ncbi:MAG: 50S ribosomal protein L11 methyltransferase, partial [Synergistaceae bacterium]
LSHWKKLLMEAMKEFSFVSIDDFGKIENQPWNVAAEEAFPPLPVGKGLVVLAPWHRGTEPADKMALYINPGSAFGTGYHESTQIVLELLEEFMKPGITTADIGTGSGILTICALKMGAQKAYARDIDPAVIEEVRKNFELNGLDLEKIDLRTGDLLKDFGYKADILTANILIDPLTSMVKDVPSVIGKDGLAIFSGMLEKESPVFL